MGASIAFGLIAASMLGSGAMAVTSKNLVHSVLWLAVSLVATSALYVALAAPFLAAMQVLLYTGGVITLMLFGVMLTDHRHEVGVLNVTQRKGPGVLIAAAIFGVLAYAVHRTELKAPPAAFDANTAKLGTVILGEQLLAFEALSVLLLAAMLGAMVLARRTDAES